MNSNFIMIASSFVGLTYEQAKEKARETGITIRVTRFNGKPSIVTRDYDPERVNLDLENDVVVSVDLG